MSPPGPTMSIVTIARGRGGHLANLLTGLARQSEPPLDVVVARMGGPALDPVVAPYGGRIEIADVAVPPGGPLPLAAARNRGAEACRGDVVIFLDIDCIPGEHLTRACGEAVGTGGVVASAQVQYLPPGVPGRWDWTEPDLRRAGRFHEIRPQVSATTALAPELLWSLAVAVARADFDGLGGFDEGYVGYGGEDTDFGVRAAEAGLSLMLATQARAYHQHHATHDPPLQHVEDIVANSRRFHDRWGRWPMEGWLADMASMGIVEWSPGASDLELVRAPRPDELQASLTLG
ncbi:MAG: glycosyltransferase family 2 protein [Acidimicrobiales bacterium]